MQGLVHALLREHQRVGQIITAEVRSFDGLRTLATSLYRGHNGDDADLEALRDLMARAAALRDERNLITHSVWAAGDTPDTVTRIKATKEVKSGLRSKFVTVDSDGLSALAHELGQLADEVQRFTIALVKAGKAS